MSLLYIDGFDHYATADLAAKGWTLAGSGPPTVTATARTGSSGLRVNTASTGSAKRGVAASDEHATFICGAAVRPTTLASAVPILGFLSDSGATTHVTIAVTSTGAIEARRGTFGGTVLGASSAGLITAGGWSYVEVLVTLSDSVGVVTVRVDGVQVLNLTGQDTKNAGTKTALDSLLVGHTSTSGGTPLDTSFDDLYLCNGAGSAPTNTFLGDVRVRTLLPNGNGNSSQLVGSDGNSTDNYALIDEATPDTADYVGSATAGEKDTYAFPNLTELTGTVFGVQQSAYSLKTDAGSRSIAHVTRSGGADYDGADIALATSAAYAISLREQDPATSAAWTIGGVNSAEFGIKVRP